VLLLIHLNAVAALDVFLDFHAHDVSVDGQAHFVCHGIDFPLLLFNCSSHVVHSLLKANLEFFPGLHLFTEALLKLVALASHLLVVHFEVIVKLIDLLLLRNRGLQVSLNSDESPLQVFVLGPRLLKGGRLCWHFHSATYKFKFQILPNFLI
jgi:hypothetical protein